MVGADFSEEAIQAARARTLGKGHHLAFEVMDMDDLQLPQGSFDAVIAIDTLYFVRDLDSAIAATKRCLSDRGRMALLHTTVIAPEEPKTTLAPGATPLARALQSCQLTYQRGTSRKMNMGVWERTLQAAEELMAEFGAEGNEWIRQGRVEEARVMLGTVRQDGAAATCTMSGNDLSRAAGAANLQRATGPSERSGAHKRTRHDVRNAAAGNGSAFHTPATLRNAPIGV